MAGFGSITPVGQILLAQGLVSQAQLDEALAIQRRSGGRIGRILLTRGHVGIQALHQAVAGHYGLPFIDLHASPADATLQDPALVADYIRLQAVPYSRDESGHTVIATAEPSEALEHWAQARYGEKLRFAITSPVDIYWHIDRHFADALDAHSREHLARLMPHKSARMVLSSRQKRELAGLALLFAAALLFYPSAVLLGFLLTINIFYFFTILLKCLLFAKGSPYRPGALIPSEALAPLADDALPVYTILVPLHDEAATIPRLMAALDALDYPKAKLDIKLIVERSDSATIEAIKAQKPHRGYELIHVPYSLPQTKPKACNYALHFARGRYVTIYDAEDIPDPLQLRKAAYWFARQPGNVICLQARLNYYNREHSLLTRLFAIEYAAWFDFMLPGLRRLGIPIPLGGTSNHIDLRKLRELGEWDPFNVTEDADLGIRIALQHYETDLLDSLTAEEAPIRLRNWMSQRTRWIRGYMQTWLVHMRHPLTLLRQLDAAAFWGFQFFIGGPCLVFLTAPVLWVVCTLWASGVIAVDSPLLSPWITALTLLNLAFGLLAHLTFAFVIIRRYRWGGMVPALYAFPLYWLLHSVASFKALWQLVTNPHFWEKTPHGLSMVDEAQQHAVLKHMQ